MRRSVAFGCAFLFLMFAAPAFPTDLRNAAGAGWWGANYWFPSQLRWGFVDALHPEAGIQLIHADGTPDTTTPVDDLNEGADRLLATGSRVIYVPLNANPLAWYRYNNPKFPVSIFGNAPADRLRAAAAGRPYFDLFRKNFDVFILAIGDNVPVCADVLATYDQNGKLMTPGHACDCSFTCHEQLGFFGLEGLLGVRDYNWAPVLDGMTPAEEVAETAAIKNLAGYLLANPDFAGKTFILADVEGDWELRSDHYGEDWNPDENSNPSKSTRLTAMKKWLVARQSGVNAARQENPTSPVHVYNASEVNHVTWAEETAMGGAQHVTVTNDVLAGLVGCCDLYTYSFWDPDPDFPAATLIDRLDFLKSKVADASPFGHSNVVMTEYGGGAVHDAHGNMMARRLTEAALAWGCPYTTYWQLYDGLNDNVTIPPTQRPTNSQTDASGLYRPDPLSNNANTELYDFFQEFSNRAMLRVGLRTFGGYYVTVDGGGGGLVHVGAPWLRQWEELSIIDQNGGSLLSGDTINILTHDGHYLMAQNSGGSGVEATSDHDHAWEKFKIFKQNGTGAIGPADVIALQSSDGHYLVAEDGGGATSLLNANRTAVGPWEQFTLVTIPNQCSYTASPTAQTVSSTGGFFSITLTTTLGCGWTVTSDSSWIAITANADGSGNATISYSVVPNLGGSRSGTITVRGQSGPVAAVTVLQSEACSILLTPSSASPNYQSGFVNVAVSGSPSGCTPSWTAAGNGSWLTISPQNGSGSGPVTVSWGQNSSTSPRSGNATIGGATFTVSQGGSPVPTCTSYSLTPSSVSPSSQSGSVNVTVTGAPAGCTTSWSTSGNGSWITVSPQNGSDAGPVTVSWGQNTSTSPRSGNATIGGTTFTVSQGGGAMVHGFYTITPCRLIDTRDPNGPYGGPSLGATALRNIVVAGQCGIPFGATSLSVNVTVVAPAAGGFLTMYPGPVGSPRPFISVINFNAGQVIGNNAFAGVGADGTINVYNGNTSSTNFIIDVNGYFK